MFFVCQKYAYLWTVSLSGNISWARSLCKAAPPPPIRCSQNIWPFFLCTNRKYRVCAAQKASLDCFALEIHLLLEGRVYIILFIISSSTQRCLLKEQSFFWKFVSIQRPSCMNLYYNEHSVGPAWNISKNHILRYNAYDSNFPLLERRIICFAKWQNLTIEMIKSFTTSSPLTL